MACNFQTNTSGNEVMHAKRLVAQKCLQGKDIRPDGSCLFNGAFWSAHLQGCLPELFRAVKRKQFTKREIIDFYKGEAAWADTPLEWAEREFNMMARHALVAHPAWEKIYTDAIANLMVDSSQLEFYFSQDYNNQFFDALGYQDCGVQLGADGTLTYRGHSNFTDPKSPVFNSFMMQLQANWIRNRRRTLQTKVKSFASMFETEALKILLMQHGIYMATAVYNFIVAPTNQKILVLTDNFHFYAAAEPKAAAAKSRSTPAGHGKIGVATSQPWKKRSVTSSMRRQVSQINKVYTRKQISEDRKHAKALKAQLSQISNDRRIAERLQRWGS